MMARSFFLLGHCAICLLNMSIVSSVPSFLSNTPGQEWKMVGNLDMTDPTQQCPDSWQKFTSPRASCGKKTNATCDGLKMTTSGASYQKVCGRFRGYQKGSPDAFRKFNLDLPTGIETYYADGISVTYGLPGNRHHVYTYAAGLRELNDPSACPCVVAEGIAPPQFVGSDYYCESGNPGPDWVFTEFYFTDVLWDRQQCGGDESACCNSTDLPWFCKTFPAPISEDLEIRICSDETLDNENVAIESFELYIQVNVQANNTRLDPSDDTYANIGITIAIAFIVFFSLGMLVTTCACCIGKIRSKVTLQTPAPQPLAREMIGSDQENITAFELEANSAYGITRRKELS